LVGVNETAPVYSGASLSVYSQKINLRADTKETSEDQRLFKLPQATYVDVRYKSKFSINNE
jgi:hypothetical protein